MADCRRLQHFSGTSTSERLYSTCSFRPVGFRKQMFALWCSYIPPYLPKLGRELGELGAYIATITTPRDGCVVT